MNSKSTIFVSASLLIGSTIVNGACPDGTLTYNSNEGGMTEALGVCNVNQQGAAGSFKRVCNSAGTGVEEIAYTDNECQTVDTNNPATDMASQISTFDCSSVADCDYIHGYAWTPTGNTCGTFTEALAAFLVESEVLTSSGSGIGEINECLDFTGQGTSYMKQTVLSCTADFEGNIVQIDSYGSDNTCTTTTGAATFTTTQGSGDAPVAEDGEDDQGNAITVNMCRRLVGCSDAATIGSPTNAPTAAPSAAPSVAPSAAPTAAPVPTTAPSAAPTAAPTTASSASQISSIVALLITSYYAIIA